MSERGVSANPSYAISLRAFDRFALDLAARLGRSVVSLGPGGVARTGSCSACLAYAYVHPRNRAAGTLTLGGERRAVAGTLWLEHEFAHRELGPGDTGWDRFTVTFDDGGIFDGRFTRGTGDRTVAVSGIRIDAKGALRYLAAATDRERDFPPGTTWRSDASGVTYPSAWLIDGLEVNELARAQEMAGEGRVPYVMGAIDALPRAGDGSAGHGFIELTGYAPSAMR